ncbi:MAG: ABC transporter permease [Actinomycetota bacterium]|nr:ABC transporter permease [Actinomycetota bacterium]
MSVSFPAVPARTGRSGALIQQARMVKVLAATAFKVRYTDTALGYFWSLARPLGLFAVLYVVFGLAFRLEHMVPNYPIFLLLGLVLFFFFSEATSRTMSSIVEQGPLLRRVAFPPLVIVIAATVFSLINFGLNLVALTVFVAGSGIAPNFSWLLLIPLMLELYVFTLAVSMILGTLHARFRDMEAIWELVTRIFFYASAIFFPVQLLPAWAERLTLVIPFGQVMQDVRALVLPPHDALTAADLLGGPIGYVWPLAITAGLFLIAIAFFRRQQPWFAERL